MTQPTKANRGLARAGSKALIREINEALVLDVVRRTGTTSRAEVTSATGLSPATVTGITGQLVRDGLLLESDVLRGTGGRPARLIQLGRDAVVAAGVRLSPDSVEIALVDLRGDVVDALSAALTATDPGSAADVVTGVVAKAAARHPSSRLRGVSVALSGIVDRARGVVRHSGVFGWEDVPFARMLAERSGTRVIIDSLVNSFSSGLALVDADLAEGDAIVVSVGPSLGASMLIDGRVHRGFEGSAGGFAHSAVGDRSADRPCHCGGAGCLETWSSIWGMRRESARRGGDADSDAPLDSDVVSEGGRRLGVALANAAKMFGPQRIVLALSPDLRAEEFAESCARALDEEYVFGDGTAPRLATPTAANDIFARGAGYDMITELFDARRADAH